MRFARPRASAWTAAPPELALNGAEVRDVLRGARRNGSTTCTPQTTFTVALAALPVQPVVVPIVSSDPAEGTVSPAEIRFDADTWQTPQVVTVTGADDARTDGARPSVGNELSGTAFRFTWLR